MKSKEPNTQILFSMFIIGVLFFIFGFVTWLNGSLIPFLQIVCELDEFEALFVTFAFYIAYTVMAYPMSIILKHTGYKKGMSLGLLVMGIGALLHIPAALSATYSVFLFALFVLATGLTILQTASNPYLVQLGPVESAAMRISIMGIINKLAGVIVPIVFTALILADMGNISPDNLAQLPESEFEELKSALSEKLVYPYLIMAAVLVALIGLIQFSNLPDLEFSDSSQQKDVIHDSVFHYPKVILGAVALFSYVGVEVIAGDTIGLYGANLQVENFASLTSFTMGFMVIGYTLGIVCIPKFVSQERALLISSIAGVLCIIGIFTTSESSFLVSTFLWGWTGVSTIPDPVTFVALMGLAHALVWPSVWPLALNGLGKLSAQASALLIMGISGGAVLPLIFGKLTIHFDSFQLAYLIGIPCYLFILFYAIKGHKMESW